MDFNWLLLGLRVHRLRVMLSFKYLCGKRDGEMRMCEKER